MCGLSYDLHDKSPDNWLGCPRDLCDLLKTLKWPAQGQSTAPDNLLAWLFANNRYPQHRGREAALKLIAELWWRLAPHSEAKAALTAARQAAR
jgi:hypothetical protein